MRKRIVQTLKAFSSYSSSVFHFLHLLTRLFHVLARPHDRLGNVIIPTSQTGKQRQVHEASKWQSGIHT